MIRSVGIFAKPHRERIGAKMPELVRWLRGHATSAAAVMVLGLVLLVILPLSALSAAAAAQAPGFISLAKGWFADGFTVPAWIDNIPWIGPWLHTELDAFLAERDRVVDDDPAVRRTYAELLRSFVSSVETAPNGETALASTTSTFR